MKTQKYIQGESYDLPDGTVGTFIEMDEYDEMRFMVNGREAYFFLQDMPVTNRTNNLLRAYPGGLVPGKKG